MMMKKKLPKNPAPTKHGHPERSATSTARGAQSRDPANKRATSKAVSRDPSTPLRFAQDDTRCKHWLVKQEPSAYSWDDFVRDGGTAWTGVRNFQARNNLKAMRAGDRVLFYHSNEGKEVVGIATVAREAYPDPTADEGGWICVDLKPVKRLKQPVTLEQIKADPALANIALIRQSRLSVMPLTAEEFANITGR
jgi:predicted RNA-binding protein with PUA-like domain